MMTKKYFWKNVKLFNYLKKLYYLFQKSKLFLVIYVTENNTSKTYILEREQ